jgi:hypothetical protein
MAPTRLVTPSLLRSAIEVMVTELCLGAESTAGATADYNQLEADFVAEMGLSGDEFLLPRHVLPTFLAFLLWVMKDIGRSRSMAGLWRTMGTLFSTWNLPDFTRYPQPRRLYKKMKTLVDTPPVPKTAATRRMFMHVLRPGGVIDLGEQSELIAHRERLCFALEGMGGGRLSETTDSGQGHGVTAVSVALITDHQDAGRQYVDILIETSKTGHARYTGAVGVSRSGVDLAGYLQSYWNASGIDTLTTTAGGLTIRRGDRWTVRLNLLGFDSRRLEEFLGVLRSSSCLSAARHAKSTAGYMRDRLAAVGKGSEAKKFVNLAAGRKACQAMRRLMVELTDAGFGSADTNSFHLVPAPLLVATEQGGGGRRVPSLMPMGAQTVYGKIGDYLASAAALATSNPNDMDPDLDIPREELSKALWGSHSLRRLSDGVARDYCLEHDIPLDRVDARMGWKEAERLRDMQHHYEEQHLRRRIRSMRLTQDM